MRILNINFFGKVGLYAILFFALTSEFALSVLGVPRALSMYVIYYIAYFLLFIIIIRQITVEKYNTFVLHIPFWQVSMLLFLIYIVITGMARRDLYGIEYHFRSYLVGYSTFCATVLFFDKKKFQYIYYIAYLLLVAHTVLSVIQSFAAAKPDNVGGIFGVSFGSSNTMSHAFIELVTMLLLTGCIKNKIKWFFFYSAVAMCLVVASVAEVKIYYFSIIIYFVLYLIFSKKRLKVILMFAFLLGMLFVGINLLVSLYPDFANFFSVEGIKIYLDSGYGGTTNAVSRSNGYSFIYEHLFEKSPLKVLFGNGFASNQNELVDEYHVIFFSYSRIFYYGGIICSVIYYYLPASVFVKMLKADADNIKLFSAFVGFGFFMFAFYSTETIAAASSVLWFFSLAVGVDRELIDNEVKDNTIEESRRLS